jgi:hypothetical protein
MALFGDVYRPCGHHICKASSAIYLDTLPLFTSGRARLIDNARLVSPFAALERRTFSTGRDRVDHGRCGRDDLCNAAALALALASVPSGYPADLSWVGDVSKLTIFDHPALRSWR